MVDKSEIAWHRQQDLCPMYDAKKDGPLKMFPINKTKGNSEITIVFQKNIWSCHGKMVVMVGRGL